MAGGRLSGVRKTNGIFNAKRVAGLPGWQVGVAGVAGNPKSRVAGTPAIALHAQEVAHAPKSWVAGVAVVADFCTPSLYTRALETKRLFQKTCHTCHPVVYDLI